MPRGAIPTPRSELSDSEPYQPEPGAEIFVPSGDFPTPNHELAAAHPFRARGTAPESFLAWPNDIGAWGNDSFSDSVWTEEAFAKACAEPKPFISEDVVLRAARECGSSNFARFMQTHGFEVDGTAFLDGPFYKVNWTNMPALHGAIADVGPVKVGVASASFTAGAYGQITSGSSGWAIYGIPTGQPENYCASLCGYGPLAALVSLFQQHRVTVQVPSGMPAGLCYAMFARNSLGIIDQQSLINITGEAWVRDPTTIVKKLGG